MMNFSISKGDTVIKLSESSPIVEISTYTERGIQQKDVPLDALLELLKDSVYEVEIPEENFEFGITGPYFIKCIQNLSDRGEFKSYHLVPGKRRKFYFFDDEFEVPYPHLLFEFNVSNKRVVDTYVYALKASDVFEYGEKHCIDPGANLYHFPFPNVGSTGKVCWGLNDLGDIDDFLSITLVIQQFFLAAYNTDLFSKERVNIEKVQSISDKDIELQILTLINEIQHKDHFQDEFLVSCGLNF